MQINAIMRNELPTTPSDIMNRLNEISFNACARGGDAGDRLRPAAARSGPARTTEVSPHLPPLRRGRGADAEVQALHQAERRLGIPADHPPLRLGGGGPVPAQSISTTIGRESTLDIQRYL
ncbi:hypothetical protein [Dankookia sp. P2]|uniref:hypothetical protein n=1 Tax=Dankookia sp. P2 TaxID=3423955 RepID=UPI003D67D7BB